MNKKFILKALRIAEKQLKQKRNDLEETALDVESEYINKDLNKTTKDLEIIKKAIKEIR